ncbi:MAG: GTP-binding protein TrmE N-terminus, partial [Actinomycetota bacterium]|nr:GTP-binding protein TrmE N-terminus [Actinomycetota bacterium]
SYTGEDVVEFQLHGNPLLVRRFLEALGELDSAAGHHAPEEQDKGLIHDACLPAAGNGNRALALQKAII